jgi:hypothetical protein
MAKDWLEELYGDAEAWELERAYFEIALADLTDDIDCSMPTIMTRASSSIYLGEKIGEDRADEILDLAFSVAKIVGFASGLPWHELEPGE